jgi:hypothetical protein
MPPSKVVFISLTENIECYRWITNLLSSEWRANQLTSFDKYLEVSNAGISIIETENVFI